MTLSITGRCARTGQLGLAMSSHDMVFHFRPHYDESLQLRPLWLAVAGVGAISAQASMRAGFSTIVMDFLREGKAAPEALEAALAREKQATKERFQLGVVDAAGRAAGFTGSQTTEWQGHRVGEGWVAAGNILACEAVVEEMGLSFEAGADLPLDERLMTSLESGINAGGDKRGHRGAYLRVTKGASGSELDIRVYEHAEPATELRRLLAVYHQEDDFAAVAFKAADVIRAALTEAELQQLGNLTTYEAIERIRALMGERGAPAESLEIVDRLLSALSEQPATAEERFSEILRMLPAA